MKNITFLVVAGFLSASVSQALTTAYSPPVGGSLVTLTGSVGGVPKVTTLSVPLRLSVAANFVGKSRGFFTSVSDTVFSDNAAGWSPGALSQSVAPYFVRIRTGAAAGTWWQISTAGTSQNTTTSVTILNRGFSPTALGVSVGDLYEIVPGDTLSTFFADVALTIGGTSAAVADAVRIHDGASWREYYFNNSPSVMKWREGTQTFDRSNTVIRPDSGIVFVRKGSGNLTLAVTGSVSDASEKVVVNSTGVAFIGSVFPVTRTLGSLNIQNMPGFVKNTGVLAAADKVRLFDGASWRTFNYNFANSQWREGTQTFNRNTFALPFGAPVILERGTGASGGYVVLSLDIPYSL